MILGRAVYLDLPLVSSVWFQRQSREPECKNEVERRSFRNVGWPSYLELAINKTGFGGSPRLTVWPSPSCSITLSSCFSFALSQGTSTLIARARLRGPGRHMVQPPPIM